MYYTYVLLSEKDGRMYTGYTSDLRKRIAAHNAGHVPATKNRDPLSSFIMRRVWTSKTQQPGNVLEDRLGEAISKIAAEAVPSSNG